MSHRVLIADDEVVMRRALRALLERAGFDVDDVGDGQAALDAALSGRYDVAVLDVMMPEVDGIEVCREVRRQTSLPVVLVTAKTSEIDTVVGLEVGADAYVTKPFAGAELIGRIRALLRRRDLDREGTPPARLRAAGIDVDLAARTVAVEGHEIRVTPAEFDVLALLMRAPGRAFTREAIMDAIGHGPFRVSPRVVDVHIANLRRKLEANPNRPRRLLTLRGHGYGIARKRG